MSVATPYNHEEMAVGQTAPESNDLEKPQTGYKRERHNLVEKNSQHVSEATLKTQPKNITSHDITVEDEPVNVKSGSAISHFEN